MAQCPGTITLTATAVGGGAVACTGGTNSACVVLTATINTTVTSGTFRFFRNTLVLGEVTVANANTASITVCGIPAGNQSFDVSIYNINAGTCSDVISASPAATILVGGTASVTAFNGPAAAICSGQTAPMTATVVGPVAGTFSLTVQNVTAGTQTVVGPFTANSGGTTTVTFNTGVLTQNTQYTITTTSTSTGCTFPQNVQASVVVNSQVPAVTIATNLNGNNVTCQGNTVTFNATIAGALAGTVTSVTWYKSSGAGFVAVINGSTGSGSSISGQGTLTLTVTNAQPTDAGNYYVVVCSNDPQYAACGGGCGASTPIGIGVNPLPTVTLTPSTQTPCVNAGANVVATFTGTAPFGIQYTISSAAGTTSQTVGGISGNTYSIPVPTNVAGAVYTVSVQQVNDAVCVNLNNASTATVTVSNFNFAVAPQTNPVCFGATTGVVVSGVTGATGTVTYTIIGNSGTLVNGTATGFGAGGTFGALPAGTYTIQGALLNGCTVTQTVVVTQQEQIILTPAVVSPITCYGNTTTITARATFATTANVDPAPGSTFTLTLTGVGGVLFTQVGVASNTTFTFPVPVGAGTYTISAASATCTVNQQLIVNQPQQIVVTALAGVPTVTCFNGTTTIAVSATGGAAAGTFTYTLSNGPAGYTPTRFSAVSGTVTQTFTNVQPGAWIVTATDANGCTRTTTVNIGNPPQLVGTVTTVNQPTCPGGAGSIVIGGVSGGTGQFRYSLSGNLTGATAATSSTTFTFNNLLTGTYTPTVIDANGCTLVLPAVSILAPPAITANVNATAIQCYGQTSTVTISSVTGSTGSITFTLTGTNANTGQPFSTSLEVVNNVPSFQISGVPAGTYSITANYPNCTANGIGTNLPTVGTLVISQPIPITVGISSVTYAPACAGTNSGTVTLTATAAGGNTFTYVLINATTGLPVATNTTGVFTNLATGTYNFQITNNTTGCVQLNNITAGQQVFVNVPAGFTAGTATNTAAACVGGTGSLTLTSAGGTGTTVFTIQYPNGTIGTGLAGSFTTTATVVNLPAGTYTITAVNGACTVNIGAVTVGGSTAAADLVINGTAPLNTVTGLTNGTYPTSASGMRIQYTITDVTTGVAATGFFVDIARPNPFFTVALDNTIASFSNWTMVQTGDRYRFTYVGQINCAGTAQAVLPVVVNYAGSGNGAVQFPLSASVINPAGDPNPFNNTWQTRLATLQ